MTLRLEWDDLTSKIKQDIRSLAVSIVLAYPEAEGAQITLDDIVIRGTVVGRVDAQPTVDLRIRWGSDGPPY